jgi:Integrase core domain/Winged helix-turn helix
MTTYQQKIIKPRLGVLELAKALGNVSQACKVMGYSRDTFYRYKELHDQGGEEALYEISRKKPCLKNRVPASVEDAVVNIALDFPAYGQERAANELRKRGIIISGGGIRSVWIRNDLESFKKRLKALEDKIAKEGIILNDAQIAALEKAKNKREACGEIETAHPGYLGSQDTYYVGNIKGIGRIYQQTFVDTYSRVAICKLYTEKTAITAADHLNDKVIPFFASQGIDLLRILTDRGSEYCGKVENHAYQLYLGIENIDHSKTKAYSPQTNGICERFHKTMQEECYNVLFRKKLYSTLAELQTDIDQWLNTYNNERPHSGKYCFGKTPMQTFRDSLYIAQEKNIGYIQEISDSMTYQNIAA